MVGSTQDSLHVRPANSAKSRRSLAADKGGHLAGEVVEDLPQERWLLACLLPPLKISRLGFLEVFLSARNIAILLLPEPLCSRTKRTGQPIANCHFGDNRSIHLIDPKSLTTFLRRGKVSHESQLFFYQDPLAYRLRAAPSLTGCFSGRHLLTSNAQSSRQAEVRLRSTTLQRTKIQCIDSECNMECAARTQRRCTHDFPKSLFSDSFCDVLCPSKRPSVVYIAFLFWT
jgi:hypothetical protein